MANTACRILAEGATQKEFDKAREYIALCNTSGVGSLMSVTGV
jgi:hypothetical protein